MQRLCSVDDCSVSDVGIAEAFNPVVAAVEPTSNVWVVLVELPVTELDAAAVPLAEAIALERSVIEE